VQKALRQKFKGEKEWKCFGGRRIGGEKGTGKGEGEERCVQLRGKSGAAKEGKLFPECHFEEIGVGGDAKNN